MNVLSPEILSRIKEIIKSSDINTISAKRIRKQVLSEFEISMDKQVLDQEIIAVYKEFVDLGQSKEKVKDEPSPVNPIDDALNTHHPSTNASETDIPIKTSTPGRLLEVDLDNIIPSKRRSGKAIISAPVKKKKKSSPKVDLVLPSPDLAKVVGEGEIPRFDVYMKIWEYAKSHSLIDTNDNRQINCDEVLELLVNSKTITISSIEDLLNPILGGSTNSTPKSKFNKQMDLSTDLQEITGLSRMSRPGVVKLLWRYIKLMGFQKGKTILNDSRLEKIFGKKKMDMFAMNKVNFVEILGNHISTQAYELKKLIQKLLGKHLYEIEEGHDQESDAQVTENSDSDI